MKQFSKAAAFALIIASAALPAWASQYGDMKNEAATRAPEFYSQALKGAAGEDKRVSFSPGGENSGNTFESALSELNDVSNRNSITAESLLDALLSSTLKDELARINESLASNAGDNGVHQKATQENLLAAAVAYSPSVKAAKDNLKASRNRYDQALFLDQLMSQYLVFTETIDTKTSSKKNQRMTQMSFPAPGMTALKGAAADKDVQIAAVAYEKTVRDLLAEVKTKYAEVLYLDESLNIARKNLVLAKNIEKVVLRMYETGSAQYNSVVKISIVVDKLTTMEDTYSRKRGAAITALRETIGLPDEIKIEEFAAPEMGDAPSLESVKTTALARSQELRSMKLMLDRMDIMIDMGSRKLLPDYSLGFSYFQNKEALTLGTQGKAPAFPTRSMGAGVMPDFASENSYLLELRDKRNAMAQNLADMTNRTASMIETYYENFRSAKNTAASYETSILKKARNAYDAALGGYTSGSVGFIDLLDAHKMLLEQELAYQEALRNERTSMAMLEKTAGGNFTVEKGADSK